MAKVYFIIYPHCPVIREDLETTKVRLVFDSPPKASKDESTKGVNFKGQRWHGNETLLRGHVMSKYVIIPLK